MSFMSKFFQGGAAGGASHQPLKPLIQKFNNTSSSSALIKQEIVPNMHYSISHWRTHTDIRPSCNVLLVHDWLATNTSWSPLIGAMQRQPQPQTEQELMLQQPLTLFCPDLPNHGKSPKLVANTAEKESSSSSPLECYAEALLEFAQRVIPSGKIHIVGFGTGGTQIALLTSATLHPERFGSFVSILGGEGDAQKMKKPLILDDKALDAEDLCKSVGDLASLNQVDDFLAKLDSAKGMSDAMRYNTGTAHCGATKWIESKNLKGTPSLQALSTKVRWNSNVSVLRSMPDYGVTVDPKLASLLSSSSSSETEESVRNYYKSNLSSSAFVIQDQSNSNNNSSSSFSSSMDLVRSVFGDFSVLQVPNTTFEGPATGARGPTSEDAEKVVVPLLSLYQDHKDYSQMMQQAQHHM